MVLHLGAPGIVMWSTAYVANISFVGLRLLLCVILEHEPLAIHLVGVMIIGVCLVLLPLATISPTFGMNTSCNPALRLVMPFIIEVCQGLGLCDGFIYSLDLSPLKLYLD